MMNNNFFFIIDNIDDFYNRISDSVGVDNISNDAKGKDDAERSSGRCAYSE